VLPSYDPSQITSLLAATLVHEFASLAALGAKEDN
jgi:agmatinase